VLTRDTSHEALAQLLFESATRQGAESLGLGGGSLELGRTADFFTMDLNDLSLAGADQASLLAHIVFAAERTAIRDVYVSGRPVIQDGRHLLQEEIVRRFCDVQRKLWNQ
jgi:formimidoylglutamate deiminase